MNSTPRADNLVMALKCVPRYARSETHDFNKAIEKCRELELELVEISVAAEAFLASVLTTGGASQATITRLQAAVAAAKADQDRDERNL